MGKDNNLIDPLNWKLKEVGRRKENEKDIIYLMEIIINEEKIIYLNISKNNYENILTKKLVVKINLEEEIINILYNGEEINPIIEIEEELPKIEKEFNQFDFISCLFANLKKQVLYSFIMDDLEDYLYKQLKKEAIRNNFNNINFDEIIENGIIKYADLDKIENDIHSSEQKIKILYNQEEIEKIIKETSIENNKIIEEIVLKYKEKLEEEKTKKLIK